jgi:hypothetical protein
MSSTSTRINSKLKQVEVVLAEVPALVVEAGEDLTVVAEVVSAVDPKLGAPIAAVAKTLNTVDQRWGVNRWTK